VSGSVHLDRFLALLVSHLLTNEHQLATMCGTLMLALSGGWCNFAPEKCRSLSDSDEEAAPSRIPRSLKFGHRFVNFHGKSRQSSLERTKALRSFVNAAVELEDVMAGVNQHEVFVRAVSLARRGSVANFN
jgi:hypothetical protein